MSNAIVHLAALLVASACAAPPPQLNSERIFERYGSYGVEILVQRDDLRITNLYSANDGDRTTRTLAIVRFEKTQNVALEEAHRQVLGGSSIGATLKSHGFTVEKTTVAMDEFQPTALAGRYLALMRLEGPLALALHAYRLQARSVNGSTYRYATIVEIHHPDYLSVSDLDAIYADQPSTSPARGEVEQLLVAGGEQANLW